MLGSGIGLASEAVAHRKQKKEGRSPSPNPSGERNTALPSGTQASTTHQYASQEGGVVEVTDDHADELIEKGHAVQVGHREDDAPVDGYHGDVVEDEEDWALDEAGEEEGGSKDATEWNEGNEVNEGNEDEKKEKVRKLLQKFLTEHPLPPNPAGHPPLPCPVILPQRRPRTKSRGFVRAYAPVLQGVGIDQATWMEFLNTFHKASQASPVFGAILVAGHLAGYVPSVAMMVASALVQAAAISAIVVQSRSRTNTFLDDINAYYFRPRGLYVLLVGYHGSSTHHKWSSEALDISHAVAKSSYPADADSSGNRGAKFKHNLQWASGSSHSGMEIPESAPLIYPDLDKAVDAEAAQGDSATSAKKPSKFKAAGNFVSEYSDRRAQAAFQGETPEAKLLVPQDKPFASRYSDPNHPASSGSLISLVTGGKVDMRGRRQQRDQSKKDRRGFMGPLGMVRHYQPAKRLLRQGVLYFMVVNMPTEEELAKAKAEMEKQVKEDGEVGGE